MGRIAGTVFVAASIMFAGAAFADDVVILDSTVASVAIGDVISDRQEVSIPGGGSVTLILASGETKVIEGPFTGPLGAAEQVESAGLDELTATRGGDTKVLGAVRAPKWEISN